MGGITYPFCGCYLSMEGIPLLYSTTGGGGPPWTGTEAWTVGGLPYVSGDPVIFNNGYSQWFYRYTGSINNYGFSNLVDGVTGCQGLRFIDTVRPCYPTTPTPTPTNTETSTSTPTLTPTLTPTSSAAAARYRYVPCGPVEHYRYIPCPE